MASNFFAVEVEAWKIGASPPAPRFNVVGKPNSWSRRISEAHERTDTELQDQYAAYWKDFGAFLKARTAPFTVSQPPLSWACRFPLGTPGVSLLASAARGNNRIAIELQLTSKATSKAFFDQLKQDQAAIESEISQRLEWLRQDEWILSRVAIATKAFIVSEREQWPKQFAWLLDYLLKFKAVFEDRVKSLNLLDTSFETEPTK